MVGEKGGWEEGLDWVSALTVFLERAEQLIRIDTF
jgi:hypothetical protein